MSRSRIRFWSFLFLGLLVLHVDWWAWEDPLLLGGWFPGWVLYAILLQFVLALALFRFGREFERPS